MNQLFFNPQNFLANASYMGKGMLTIIIVMLVIIGVTALLNKTTSNKK